jgi:hypothetical protein
LSCWSANNRMRREAPRPDRPSDTDAAGQDRFQADSCHACGDELLERVKSQFEGMAHSHVVVSRVRLAPGTGQSRSSQAALLKLVRQPWPPATLGTRPPSHPIGETGPSCSCRPVDPGHVERRRLLPASKSCVTGTRPGWGPRGVSDGCIVRGRPRPR